MASRVAGKIKLQSVDELLGVPEIAGTQEIEIGRIHAFPNHPFKVLDDEKMDTLVDSIRENGILNPVIVRPDQSGNYEMISGHRRLHAAGIVGLKKVPAIVKEMSDDEAIIIMVDANVQREERAIRPRFGISRNICLPHCLMHQVRSAVTIRQRLTMIIPSMQ